VILDFTKRILQPGMTALEMRGSIHCGPECARLEREVEGMIAARQTRVIFDMAGVSHADSAAIGAIVRCLTKLKSAGGALRIAEIDKGRHPNRDISHGGSGSEGIFGAGRKRRSASLTFSRVHIT